MTAAWQGRRTYLRPVGAGDAGWLHRLTQGFDAEGWRFGGLTLDPEAFTRHMWPDMPSQLVVCSRALDAPVGLVQTYALDLISRHASIAVIIDEPHWNAGWPFEGVVLALDWFLRQLDLRRLYFEVAAPLHERLGGTTRHLVECGRLRDHVRVAGGVHDLVILRLERDSYDAAFVDRYLRAPGAVPAP